MIKNHNHAYEPATLLVAVLVLAVSPVRLELAPRPYHHQLLLITLAIRVNGFDGQHHLLVAAVVARVRIHGLSGRCYFLELKNNGGLVSLYGKVVVGGRQKRQANTVQFELRTKWSWSWMTLLRHKRYKQGCFFNIFGIIGTAKNMWELAIYYFK